MLLKINETKYLNTDCFIAVGVNSIDQEVNLTEEELKAEELKTPAERSKTKKEFKGWGIVALLNNGQDLLCLVDSKEKAEAELKSLCELINLHKNKE